MTLSECVNIIQCNDDVMKIRIMLNQCEIWHYRSSISEMTGKCWVFNNEIICHKNNDEDSIRLSDSVFDYKFSQAALHDYFDEYTFTKYPRNWSTVKLDLIDVNQIK